MMRGVSGGWALPVLLFFSIPFAHEAESISLSKKMSTAELMYADQLLFWYYQIDLSPFE
jgi:hypothetical protein